MSFNIDDMDDNILHAIAVAKETYHSLITSSISWYSCATSI